MAVRTQHVLRLGTRGSLLARMQSQRVADELMRLHPGLRVELEILKTTGDKVQDRPLHEIGGKGLFTKELEQALIDRRVDFAVHSFKDVPVTMPLVDVSTLEIVAVPKREDPRDVAVMRDPSKGPLPSKARVGTSSLRRRCQVLDKAPDVTILPLRGNVDTRIRKVRDGEYDVVILAMAGLKRSKLFDASFMTPLDLVPAPAQGALALQCRKDDTETRKILSAMDDSETHLCVNAERAIVQVLHGDCHSPIAALASIEQGTFRLKVAIGHRDGNPPVLHIEQSRPISEWERVVEEMGQALRERGAMEMLRA